MTDKLIQPSDALLQETPKPLNWVVEEVEVIRISFGSVNRIDSETWHPLLSSMTKLYSPAIRFSIKEVFAEKPLGPVHEYEKGGNNPWEEASIKPSEPPKQERLKPL